MVDRSLIETTLAGWVLALSVCAQKIAGWVNSVVPLSRNPTVLLQELEKTTPQYTNTRQH